MSSPSPPPTPPAQPPRTRAETRFKPSVLACEWSEEYRPGGFHPIKFGDTLAGGRYRIIRKLGNGSFSTVWLGATDGIDVPKYVAIKIMTAKQSLSGASNELRTAEVLSALDEDAPETTHVLLPLDYFDEKGPNGTHRCLTYEPMGVTVASGVDKLPQFRDKVRFMNDTWRYPKWMVKIILKHTLLGLASLHRRNVVHGDLQPGNLLFATNGLHAAGEDELVQTTGATTGCVVRLDGKKDKWAPPYLALGQPLYAYADFTENLEIRISDLGAAFFRDDPPAKIVTPFALRAPEIILKQQINEKIDIWSFGCLVYELITNTQLFPVAPYDEGQQEEGDDDHLLTLNNILGDLPQDVMTIWSRSASYFGPNRERLNPRAALPEGSGLFNPELWTNDSLETLFDQNKPPEVNEAEAVIIVALIRRVLKYDASQRPTAEELLEDPWFHSE